MDDSICDKASKMLRRKIPQTGHMMTNKKFWLQAIPTNDCDVLMTFPPDTAESTVVWFKARLQRLSELVVITRSLSLAKRATFKPCYAFHITAQYQGFLRGLEELHIPKPLREDLGGGTKEFSLKECNKFNNVEDAEKFLSSSEKSEILLHFLNSLKAEKGDEVANIVFREGEAIVPKSMSCGVILQLFPLHETDKLKELQKTWVQRFLAFQPLDLISQYYGIKIGYYFAWLGHYTIALFIPAVVGCLFWFFFHGRSEFLEDLGSVLFAFFNVIWATLYLESWKRRSAELSFKWDTHDLQRDELLADPRPVFEGEERLSEITGKPELHYSPWKRNLFRYFVTVPVISLALLIVLLSVFLILELQQWWDKVILEQNYFKFFKYGPKILLALVIPMFDGVYNQVAIWLNDMENYKIDERYEKHLIIKKTMFQFVNSFLALFYTAFYLQDMDKLRELLAALLITRQVVGNIKESLIPYVKKQMKMAKMSFDIFGALSPTEEANGAIGEENDDKKTDGERKESVSPDRNVSQAEMEASNPQYDGTFDDYLEMFIQFGYVTLFSSAYPLAGLCALLNNLIEIRSDAFKLCIIHQRPFPQRVQNIGSWQTAMEVMGLIGVMVNCGLIGLSGPVHRIFPNITGSQTVILIIVLEHFMLLLKVLISAAIPDVPSWVCVEMAKLEHRRREAERNAGITGPPMCGSISLDTEERGVQTNMEVENDADVSASSRTFSVPTTL